MLILTINTSTKYTLNKIQFMTSIKLLHVSASGYHHKKVIQNTHSVYTARHDTLHTLNLDKITSDHIRSTQMFVYRAYTKECCGFNSEHY